MPNFQPMLGAKLDFAKLSFPVLASPKLDGIRCIVNDAYAYPLTRTLKPVPNRHIKLCFDKAWSNGFTLHGLDGELIVGEPWHEQVFNRTTSGVMSQGGEPDFKFHIFDLWDTQAGFAMRQEQLRRRFNDGLPSWCTIVEQALCHTHEDIFAFEEHCLSLGYEGIVVRSPTAPYKFGRSTVREGGLLKLKRWEDAEAEIIGFEELLHNNNESTLDERGYAKRSTHASGKSASGMMGKVIGRIITGPFAGKEVKVGSGFTEAERIAMWRDPALFLGERFTFKYFPHGSLDLPRHPIWKGLRKD